MNKLLNVLRSAIVIPSMFFIEACPIDTGEKDGSGTIYACSYEYRSTGCGGVGWSEWTTQCYQFNIDDYQEGWTPERVCNKYMGSGTECGGSCCINYEYRNNVISKGNCS